MVAIVVCVDGFFRSRLLLLFVEVAIVVADTVLLLIVVMVVMVVMLLILLDVVMLPRAARCTVPWWHVYHCGRPDRGQRQVTSDERSVTLST